LDGSNGYGYAIARVGTTLSLGARGAALTGPSKSIKLSATKVLIVGIAAGSPSPIKACVFTFSSLTITEGSTVTSSESINAGAGTRHLLAFGDSGDVLSVCKDNSVSTTSNFFAITVSGTIPTIGTALTMTSVPSPATVFEIEKNFPFPFVSDLTNRVTSYDDTTILVGLGVSPFAITISGSTLTSGTLLDARGSSQIVKDTDGVTFIKGNSPNTFTKATVSGGTITEVETVAAAPTLINTAVINNAAAKYGGKWYSWQLTTSVQMLDAEKYVSISGSDINIIGPIN